MPNTNSVKRKILFLGGSGFIGRAVLHNLLSSNDFEIVTLQHREAIPATHPSMRIIQGKIGDIDLEKLPFFPDIIIHAARNRTGKLGAWGRKWKAAQGKHENQKLLNQCLHLKNPPTIFYFSGSLMYGHHPGKFVDEDTSLNPISFAREYQMAEQPFLAMQDKLPIVMIRLPWVIGNGSWFLWKYLNYMQRHHAVPIYGSGKNKMCFIDVEAIAPAILHLIQINFSGILNLYYPDYLSQNNWAKLLASSAGLEVEKLSVKRWKAEPLAVRKSFSAETCLHSKHFELQKTLQTMQTPLEQTIKKHLSAMLQNK